MEQFPLSEAESEKVKKRKKTLNIKDRYTYPETFPENEFSGIEYVINVKFSWSYWRAQI